MLTFGSRYVVCLHTYWLPKDKLILTYKPVDLMKIDEYISNLRNNGIVVFMRDNRIAVNASKGALTPEITAELTARKQEILSFYESINSAAGSDGSENGVSLELNFDALKDFEEKELYDIAFQQRKEYQTSLP